ncbi:MAG: hypothetical protein OIF32_12745 [Campylobacterales bacterium]|nr:hypothetical protein [Campylobacterales bacterium]
MKSFKNHLSLIFALVSLLFSFQFLTGTTQVVDEYERYLGENYSIVAVSTTKLTYEAVSRVSIKIKGIEELDPTFMIDSLKDNLSPENIAYLKVTLPHFYKIKLYEYPSIKDRERIKEALLQIKSISKLETFAKNQNHIYDLLILNKTVLIVLTSLIAVIAVLLMVRQMEVWLYEHSQRMYIMSVFGASLFQKSAVLFLLAILDSIISTVIVVVSYYYLTMNQYIQSVFEEIGISKFRFDLVGDSVALLSLSFVLSILCVMYVIVNAED